MIDPNTNRVYVGAADGKVHALDLATGAEASGWPVTVTTYPQHNYAESALTLWQGRLYAETASHCDALPYEGRITAIDTATHSVAHVLFVTRQGQGRGGGIWGWAGVSVDAADGNVYAATGNGPTFYGEDIDYANSVVRLTRDLDVVASNRPPLQGFDDDFGSTPLSTNATGARRSSPSCARTATCRSTTGTA